MENGKPKLDTHEELALAILDRLDTENFTKTQDVYELIAGDEDRRRDLYDHLRAMVRLGLVQIRGTRYAASYKITTIGAVVQQMLRQKAEVEPNTA